MLRWGLQASAYDFPFLVILKSYVGCDTYSDMISGCDIKITTTIIMNFVVIYFVVYTTLSNNIKGNSVVNMAKT